MSKKKQINHSRPKKRDIAEAFDYAASDEELHSERFNLERVDLGYRSYVIAEAYEDVKQALISRLHQLVAVLTKDVAELPETWSEGGKLLFYPRSTAGLVILPTGDWYLDREGTTGNIISLIQYFTGADVCDAIEWAWGSFICDTQPDIFEFAK